MAVSRDPIAQLEAEEKKLEEAGVPRTRWMYISANKQYDTSTPTEDRLGGFSCDREWIIKDCGQYPHLFHAVVDGGNTDNVMFYVGGTFFYNRRTEECIEREKIRDWIKEELENHRQGKCSNDKSA
jgi:hypothetical protein